MTQAALIQTLSIEAGAIAAFGRALADEREAIKRQDFQALTDLLGKKMELAQALTRATAAREVVRSMTARVPKVSVRAAAVWLYTRLRSRREARRRAAHAASQVLRR